MTIGISKFTGAAMLFLMGALAASSAAAQTRFTQCTDPNTLALGTGVACTNTAAGTIVDNQWWRVYNLATLLPGVAFRVEAFRVGIEESSVSANTFEMRVYSQTGAAFPAGTRTLLGTTQTIVEPTAGAFTNSIRVLPFATPVNVPANTMLVCEFAVLDNVALGGIFFPGVNSSGESAPLYITSTGCAITTPTTLTSLSFTDQHMIFDVIGNGPEMDVQRPAATSITDGGTDALGGVPITGQSFTYTILNNGFANLQLPNPSVTVTPGTGTPTVSVTAQPATSVPFSGANTTTFTVQVTPAAGAFTFTLSIASGTTTILGLDFNENPYNFTVSGTGTGGAAPTLTLVTPATGSTLGGTACTLTGTGFTGATSVTFGGTAATALVVVSATSITCTTAAHAAGLVSVLVTTPSGTNAANTLFTYTAPAAPTLTLVTPATGSTAGGTACTLTGTGFTGATGVTFAGTAATALVVVSATSITCTSPAGAAGTASVVVTTPGGSNAANTLYTYIAPPTLTLVTPATGSTAGGTACTLTGTNFTGATGVTFDGSAATAVVVVSATSITCTTPAHAVGAVSVVVTTPGGSNAANTLFTYVATPSPEMDVTRGATPVADGAATDPLGGVPFGAAQTVTYTITNSGTAGLNLTGAPTLVVVTAVLNVTSVTVTTQPAASIAAAGTTTFVVTYTATAAGVFSFTVSIANNDANENPYNWTADGTGTSAPEIGVTRGAAIVDGGTDAAGNAVIAAVTTLTYTISNTGNAALTITNPVTIAGLVNCVATVTTAPAASVAAAGTTTLVISVTPTAAGAFSFTVSAVNNDANENPYNWTVNGTGTTLGGGGTTGGGGGGGGCSATGTQPHWLTLSGLALLAMFLVGRRMRRASQ